MITEPRIGYEAALSAVSTLVKVVPLLGGSHNRQDYESALAFVEYLIDNDDDNPLINILADKIAEYENSAPEYADFNASLQGIPKELAMLRTIMSQNGLNQSDFANEIGGRSLVSMILSGDRCLTLEHMRALSARFGLPVSAFIDI